MEIRRGTIFQTLEWATRRDSRSIAVRFEWNQFDFREHTKGLRECDEFPAFGILFSDSFIKT
ncbi:MAG: hypothetical protein ACI8XB_002790 [Patiriisocius sp.]|jgi:hypothetical protein